MFRDGGNIQSFPNNCDSTSFSMAVGGEKIIQTSQGDNQRVGVKGCIDKRTLCAIKDPMAPVVAATATATARLAASATAVTLMVVVAFSKITPNYSLQAC